MTMQVAMIAADGILLASDLKWVTLVETPRGPRRKEEYKSKIRSNGEIAICCAGEDMDYSTKLAETILAHWRDGDGDELQRVREIVKPPLENKQIECIVAFAPPRKKLIYIVNSMVRNDDEIEWRTFISPVRRVQSAGDPANDARFWLRYYDASLSVQELKRLAVHLVVEAQHFNNAMIGGLEVVVSEGSAFRSLSEDECQPLEAEAKKLASQIGELILRPPEGE